MDSLTLTLLSPFVLSVGESVMAHPDEVDILSPFVLSEAESSVHPGRSEAEWKDALAPPLSRLIRDS